MNSFEQIISKIFEHKKYWVKANVRVDLTKTEKRNIMKDPKRSSIPRPEIDLVAYSPVRNEFLIIEVKSYFNSNGILKSELVKEHETPEGDYKLLTCTNYRSVVTQALLKKWIEMDLVLANPVVKYVLVAGRVFPDNDANEIKQIKELLAKRNIDLMDINEIRSALRKIADTGYEDDVVTMATKIYKDPELLE